VPDGLLGGVPHPAGRLAGRPDRVGGPGRLVELVGDVVVLVPDEHVRVVPAAGGVHRAAEVRPVLEVPLDDGVGRDRGVDDVALPGVDVDGDVDLRGRVAVDDVERDAVEGHGPVGGAVGVPVGVEVDAGADVRDDRRRVTRHRRGADVLVPRVV